MFSTGCKKYIVLSWFETETIVFSMCMMHKQTLNTVHLFHRDLSKDVQIRPVENPAKDAIQARVVGVKQSLIGYSVCHEPHPQEEEEEEDILHLNRKKTFRHCDPKILISNIGVMSIKG